MDKKDLSALPYPKIGDKVFVIEKRNYGTDDFTNGVVKDILTKQQGHPRGTKVRLTNGIIGRVQGFIGQDKIVSIFEKEEQEETIITEDEEMLV